MGLNHGPHLTRFLPRERISDIPSFSFRRIVPAQQGALSAEIVGPQRVSGQKRESVRPTLPTVGFWALKSCGLCDLEGQ